MKTRLLLARGLGAAGLLALAGCAQCAPDVVGAGVARLTVRNVGAMASIVNADATCGFSSPAVLAAATTQGEIGGPGKLTLTVTGCTIDLDDTPFLDEDCSGNTTTATGRLTISATRTIEGTLTGNAANPIIPNGPDALSIRLVDARFDGFEVKSSSSDSSLRMISGGISAEVRPRLAVSASNGACAIATPNVQMVDIVYAQSTVHVESPDNSFDADVATSSIAAQNGKNGGAENTISGRITVFGTDVEAAGPEGSDAALDPEYDAAAFQASYACEEDLAQPESFICDPTQRIADGAARLSVKMLGTVAGLVDADTVCGFSSPGVQANAALTGIPGELGALTLTTTACRFSFPVETPLSDDCNGDHTVVTGTVTVSGTKTLSGRVTGDPTQPIVPVTSQPAAIALTIEVDGFRVANNVDANALVGVSGSLAGTVRPKVFVGADTNVCSVSTPNADFDDIRWTNAELSVVSAAGEIDLPVEAAALNATNGVTPAGTNRLEGSVTIGGETLPVPSDGAGLDPEYDANELEATWQCNPALADPLSDQCAGAAAGLLGAGAAGLTMRTFGTVASLVDANTSCGFSSLAVGGTPSFTGDVGDDDVTATFSLPNGGCTIQLPAGTVISTDCAGTETKVGGTVVVTGTKAVTGFRTGDPAEPVVPTRFKPASFDLTMVFTELLVESSASDSSLTVHSGQLSGSMSPRLGLDTTTGACSIATPNVSFSDVTWANGDVTLRSDGSAFRLALAASDLDAQSGSDDVNTNALTGSITVDGIPIAGLALPLDPAFTQAAFDASYACTPNLLVVPDEACSFRGVLGQAAARLLVKAAGTAASLVDANTSCGFADATPGTAPIITGSPGGVGNVTLTADASCAVQLPPTPVTIATDCLLTDTFAGGGFSVLAATKSINGFLTGANPPVFPVTRDAARLTLGDIAFADFEVFDELADNSIPAAVTVTGTASVVVEPIAGRSEGASTAASAATGGAITNVFSNKTAVARIGSLTMANGTVTIVSEGKTFRVDVSDVELDAFAGAFVNGGTAVGSNDISGSITVDGEPLTIGAGSPLVDPYSQAVFDSTYTCNPDLNGDVVPFE